jgi:hypothetical protein
MLTPKILIRICFNMDHSDFNFGPITRQLLSRAEWYGKDDFPAFQEWADELEMLLQFANSLGQFQRYFPRRLKQEEKRDETLSEVRAALFFERNGFKVCEWEPPGASGKRGDLLIKAGCHRRVFVEVKSPGWQGELTPEEHKAGRKCLDKYIDGDGRSVAGWKALRHSISKAYEKFESNKRNLLFVADDLFIPLIRESDGAPGLQTEIALRARSDIYDGKPGYFTTRDYELLGGVLLFSAQLSNGRILYRGRYFENPCATRKAKLPKRMTKLNVDIMLPKKRRNFHKD